MKVPLPNAKVYAVEIQIHLLSHPQHNLVAQVFFEGLEYAGTNLLKRKPTEQQSVKKTFLNGNKVWHKIPEVEAEASLGYETGRPLPARASITRCTLPTGREMLC